MKSFSVVKSISKSLIGISAFGLFLFLGVSLYPTITSNLTYSANEATTDNPYNLVDINLELSDHKMLLEEDSSVTITPSINGSPTYPVDHISLFISEPEKIYNQKFTTEARNQICGLLGKSVISPDGTNNSIPPSEPFSRFLGTSTKNANGSFSTVTWSDPSSSGIRQIFGIAMKSPSSVECQADNIVGWSLWDSDAIKSYVNVYTETAATGEVITVNAEDRIAKGSPVRVTITVNPPYGKSIDHISILFAKPGASLEPIPENICKQADEPGETCIFCLIHSEKLPNPSQPYSFTYTYDNGFELIGNYKVIAVAIINTAACNWEEPNRNFMTANYEKIIESFDQSDPTNLIGNPGGTTPPGGGIGGGGGASQIALKEPEKIKNMSILFENIQTALIEIIAAFAIIGIIVGGIQYISSAGDPAKADKAKKTIIFTILGVMLSLLTYIIYVVLQNTLKMI